VAARAIRCAFAIAVIVAGVLDQTQFNLAGKQAGLRQLAQAETLNPNDARVFFNRAKLLLREGDATTAERELKSAIAINPRSLPAQQLMGELLMKSGATAAGLEHYNRMMEMFRPDLASLMNSGVLARQLGSNTLALRRFDDALQLAPEQVRLHYLKADALLANGDTNVAASEFAVYLKAHEGGAGSSEELPVYLSASFKLGELRAAGSQWSEAAQLWQHAADVAVAFRRFSDAAGLLQRVADAQERLGQYAEAASSRRAAVKAAELAAPGK
jgi:tetratricopeptide (TPR) repeat protein